MTNLKYSISSLDLPCEFRNLADKIVVGSFLFSFRVNVRETDIVPEGDDLSSGAVLGVDTVVQGIFLSLRFEIDVFVGTQRVGAAQAAASIIEGYENFFHGDCILDVFGLCFPNGWYEIVWFSRLSEWFCRQF